MPRMKALSRKQRNRFNRLLRPATSPFWKRSQIKPGRLLLNIKSKTFAVVAERPDSWYVPVWRLALKRGRPMKVRWYLPWVRVRKRK